MNIHSFTSKKTGRIVNSDVSGNPYCFIPDGLPPGWENEKDIYKLLVEAHSKLSHLDGTGMHLPNSMLLIKPLHHLEAQASSALEGTITHPQQQMLFDIEENELTVSEDDRNDLLEVSNYKKALNIRDNEFCDLPICKRLMKELHRILLDGVRGESRDPGSFRRLPVQIGRPARFVPPPAQEIDDLLDNLEKFINDDTTYDPLVKAFIAHYQFETIHPFLDGNGRVGRLLLSLMIKEQCKLHQEWLYLSPYFNRNKEEYITRLFQVSANAEWTEWLEFCLKGVISESDATERRCQSLLSIQALYHEKINNSSVNNNRLNQIVDNLFVSPLVTNQILQNHYGITRQTAYADIQFLVKEKILSESDIRYKRSKVYFSEEILNIIYGDEGLF